MEQCRKYAGGEDVAALEAAVRENPHDGGHVYRLGREYLRLGRWDMCIKTLIRHLLTPGAVWADERSDSMCCIARAYKAKGDFANAKKWYLRAAAEAGHLREPFAELSQLLYELHEYEGAAYFEKCALMIDERKKNA